MNTRIVGVVSALLICTAAVVRADPVCGVPPSYASWTTSGFSCMVGSLDFSNFTFQSPSMSPTAVSVGPLTDANGSGFDFNPNVTLGPSSTTDEKLSFAVHATDPAALINDAFIFFNGNGMGSFATNFNELICTGVTTAVGCTAANEVMLDAANPPMSLQDHVTFGATTDLFVLADLGATTGMNGSLDISDLKTEFSTTAVSPVPEPASLVLIGLGLLGVRMRGRRSDTKPSRGGSKRN